MKKLLSFILLLAMSAFLFSFVSNAQSFVNVYIDGERFDPSGVRVINDTTYVAVRKFSKAIDPSCNVTYSYSSRTLNVSSKNLNMSVTDDFNYIVANGRYLYSENPIVMKNGVMYAPILTIYKAFGAKISWSDESSGFLIKKGNGGIVSARYYYDDDCVYWLSKIISAESQGEPLIGKIAVGNVILNRVESNDYPNTIYGVIFDKRFGTQFSPVDNGTIYNSATPESVVAAKICLEGYSINNDILYFVNPKKAPVSWISTHCIYWRQIGNHAFYK